MSRSGGFYVSVVNPSSITTSGSNLWQSRLSSQFRGSYEIGLARFLRRH
jgi:hypothetical protein